MNILKTVVLLALLTALLISIGFVLEGGILGAAIGLLAAGLLNFVAWFQSDHLALQFHGAIKPTVDQEARLQPMIDRLCQRAQLPCPKLYVIPASYANAFATGRDPHHGAIAVTQGLLNLLDDAEVEAVLAHELSHIQHYDTLTQTIAATLAGAIGLFAQLAGNSGGGFRLFRFNLPVLVGWLFTVMLAPITATMIQMLLSQTREFAADAGSAHLTRNPIALAQALEKLENWSRQQSIHTSVAFAPLFIVNPFRGDLLNRLFSTHPPTQERTEHLKKLSQGLRNPTLMMKSTKAQLKRRSFISLALIAAAIALTVAPLPGITRTIVVVSGTELQEPLQALKTRFEQEHPDIRLDLKFQGSQELVNRYLDDKNDFKPTVLIPANEALLQELSDRWRAQNSSDPFYELPRPVAKTRLVAIAWVDRGKALFPDGRFRWERVEQAMQVNNWSAIGGAKTWGSFDFVMTDPGRSNSGQLTLSLWAKSKLGGGSLQPAALNTPSVQSLFTLVKRSVYQPPRSTDILLQEFIARGPNDADVATVYESIALNRWQQARANQGEPYQIYYLDPTFETQSTAAIVRRDVEGNQAGAARTFLDFLTQPNQQSVFVQYGFRPVVGSVDLKAVPNSPWSQNIPGAEVNPPGQVTPAPDAAVLVEVNRLWERAN